MKSFKYIFEGTEGVRYRYEVYADSDDAAFSRGVHYPYIKDIIAEIGDPTDVQLISKSKWDETSKQWIPVQEEIMTEKKTRVVTEADVVKELDALWEDCTYRRVELNEGMNRLKKWVARYEEVTGTSELTHMLFQYWTIGGVLHRIYTVARTETLTCEQRIKEIQIATSEMGPTPGWFINIREVFYPMDFWDFYGLVGRVQDTLKEDWFRRSLMRTELEEEIEETEDEE